MGYNYKGFDVPETHVTINTENSVQNDLCNCARVTRKCYGTNNSAGGCGKDKCLFDTYSIRARTFFKMFIKEGKHKKIEKLGFIFKNRQFT